MLYTWYQSGAIIQVKNTANGNRNIMTPPTSYTTIMTLTPLEEETECQL